MVRSVSISDTQFRIGVGAAGAALVALLSTLRFCGGVTLPDKPPPPAAATHGTSSQLFTRSQSSPTVYLDFLGKDAAVAGVPAPSLAQMSRKLPDHVDDERHVLEVGAAPLEVAGLRLRALHVDGQGTPLAGSAGGARDDGLALEITNATGAAVAYNVETQPIPLAGCEAARPLWFNAMTIAKDHVETRIECAWREGMALAVTRVEAIEVPPLSAWYLDHVPPAVVGIEPRIARGHRGTTAGLRCSFAMPQAVRSGLERGEIRWRDLVDFYSRHRCETYHFPLTYRMFSSDNERIVPAASAAM